MMDEVEACHVYNHVLMASRLHIDHSSSVDIQGLVVTPRPSIIY